MGTPPAGQFDGQPAQSHPQQYASGPVAAMPPAKEVSPGTANAFKLGAIVGATLFGTALAVVIVLTLILVAVSDSSGGVNDPGIFAVLGLFTNMAFGGHVSFNSVISFLPSGAGGLFLITFSLIAAGVAIFVGNKVWKTSPLEKAQEVWIAIATIFGVSYILTVVFTLLTATTVPDRGQISGSYGRPFFWLAIFSIAVGLIIASINGKYIPMMQKIASFRGYWAPGLMTAILTSVVALVFILIISMVTFGLPEFSTVAGIFVLIVNVLLASMPLLFGTKMELGGFQESSSIWSQGEGLTVLLLIIGVIVTLIAGSVFRQRVRGYDTNPIYIASDAGVFAILGILAVATMSFGNSEKIHVGLAYSAILINAVVGAVIAAIHVYLFPLIRGSAPGLARAMQNYTQRPLPQWLTPFVYYGAAPQTAYGQGFAPQGMQGAPGQFPQQPGYGQVPPPGMAQPQQAAAGMAPSAASAPGAPVAPHDPNAQPAQGSPADSTSETQQNTGILQADSAVSADAASAASAPGVAPSAPAGAPSAPQPGQVPPAHMQQGMQQGYPPQQYAAMPQPGMPQIMQRSPEEEAAAKARNRKIAAIVAAVVGVLVIAFVGIKIVNSMMFGPQSTVEDYWAALANGRAGTAQSMEMNSETSPLMSDDVYGAAENRPTNITSVEVSDEPYTEYGGEVEQRVFTVKYDLGGVTYSTDTTVRHSGKKYGFFDKWSIVGSQVGSISISSVQPVTVNGAVQVQPEGYLVYPGTYTITDSEDNPYLTLTSEPGTVAVGEDIYIETSTELTEEAQQLAYDAVEELLNECNNATDGDGDNPCNLSMWVYPSDQYEFSWSVPTDPGTLNFSEGYDAVWNFGSDTPYEAVGTATPKADADPDYDLEVETERDTFSVSGTIDFTDPANPIVEVEGSYW